MWPAQNSIEKTQTKTFGSFMDKNRYVNQHQQFPAFGWLTGKPSYSVPPSDVLDEDALIRHPSSRIVATGYQPPQLTGSDISHMVLMPAQLQPQYSLMRQPRVRFREMGNVRWPYPVPVVDYPSHFEMPGALNLDMTRWERDRANPYGPIPVINSSYGSKGFSQKVW